MSNWIDTVTHMREPCSVMYGRVTCAKLGEASALRK